MPDPDENDAGTTDEQQAEIIRIDCPDCGMPYDVPEDVERWSCDCGVSWEVA